jgi:hypothetical protein
MSNCEAYLRQEIESLKNEAQFYKQELEAVLMNKNFADTLSEFSKLYQEGAEINRAQEEATWKSLSKEQQLDVFCAVVRRIHQAEIIDNGSYRYALYTVFGFEYDSYGRAMDAGYLDLHNAIEVKV